MKKLSVLVININNLNYTKNCINDLLNQTVKDFSITLIDQGSIEEGTNEYLNSLSSINNINIIRNSENISIHKLWNDFYKNNENDYLCYLNNDVKLTDNFIEDTINILDKDDKVGIVVHSTNSHKYNRKLDELDYKFCNEKIKQGWDFTIRKKLYVLIPSILKFYYGDDWIFHHVYKQNYKVAVCISSPIIHYSTRSSKYAKIKPQDEKENYCSICEYEWMPNYSEYTEQIPTFKNFDDDPIETIIYYNNTNDKDVYFKNDEFIKLNKSIIDKYGYFLLNITNFDAFLDDSIKMLINVAINNAINSGYKKWGICDPLMKYTLPLYLKHLYNYKIIKDNITENKKTLAITVYIDDNINIINEFEWLYKSFIYSGNYINSDIVAFCNPSVINKLDINIINDSNVILIPLEPLSSKDLLWKDYKFINSIYFLTTKEAEILLKYKYVLSTDCDVFLTKNLIDFRPHLHTFGLGHYISEWDSLSRNNIENILKKLNLKYNFIHNVGASYLYLSQHVINFRKFQLDICKYLINNEFKDEGKWGSWFKGTLTMYAGEITANQLGVSGIMTNVLDSYSMTDNKIGNTFYHIHAWHTHQYFSKHNFRNGEYKDINVDELDIEIVNNYCLYLATKSIDEIKNICNYR